ncbi:thioredoxin family protein [Tengunoibacter tsumagoiensis]|uniref:Thioredoxin n=1 Tax=Tengunoibacter tsumagoiensis TaxID=2014871 RepID=A0A401ZXQ1_9CHLR|nr:thioredoxin family protein [Tengunoibacter tsumagoiensis]GCE11612.1 thioredoxin [Tengunoibacter tsumagoiensis]
MNVHSNLLAVKDQDFSLQVLQSTLPVIVDFWAEWCHHCHTLAPRYAQLSTLYAGKVRFATINADENPQIAAQFGVQGLPTLILFNAGQPIAHIVGPQPARLQQRIEQALIENQLASSIPVGERLEAK